jgi:2'-5' RNA ligase
VAWGREAAAVMGVGRAGHGLRVLDAASVHLTLSFLGGRPVDQLDELADSMAGACEGFASLELTLGAPAWLPPRRPRALAVEVHDASGELVRLQGSVELALGAADGRPRRYRPHVTVARTRSDFRVPASIELPVTPAASFRAEGVSLVRSWLEPGGARYEPQRTVTLGPGPG